MICYMSHLFFWLFVLRKVVFFIYIQHQIINKSESYYKWVQLVLAQLNISVNIEYCRLYRFGTYITECNHVCLALPTQINIYGMVQVLLCYTILGIYKRKKGNKKSYRSKIYIGREGESYNMYKFTSTYRCAFVFCFSTFQSMHCDHNMIMSFILKLQAL